MYHISRNGQQTGPFTEEQLRQMAATGQLQPQDLIWRQGDASWQPAANLPGLFRGQPMAQPAPQPNLYGPPGAHPYAMHAGAPIPNYLAQAIIVTVLCCLPFGIPAIVYSSQVNSKQAMGDIAGAQESSQKAKFWCWLAFWLGLIPIVIWIVVVAVAGTASFSATRNF